MKLSSRTANNPQLKNKTMLNQQQRSSSLPIIIFGVLWVLLCMYNDFITGQYFGTIARTPFFILSPLLAIFIIYTLHKNRTLFLLTTDRAVILYATYAVCISLLQIAMQIAKHGTALNFWGDNYFIKLINYLSYYALLYLVYYCTREIFGKIRPITIYRIMTTTVIFMIFFLLIEYFTKPNAFPFIHFNRPIPYTEIRLLGYETSVGSLLPIILTACCLFFSRIHNKKFGIFMGLAFIVLYTYLNNSKGFLLSLLLTVTLISFQNILHPNKIKTTLLIITASIIIYFTTIYLIDKNTVLHLSATNAGSYTTRITFLIASILTLIQHPLGVGYGILQQILFHNMPHAIQITEKILPLHDINEILTYSYKSTGFANKTELGAIISSTGITGIIFLGYFLVKYYNRIKKIQYSYPIMFAYFFLIIAMFSYISFFNNYAICFFFGIIDSIVIKLHQEKVIIINI